MYLGTKELLKAKKIMDEQQAKLALEMQKREKMEFIKEKKRMEELLKKVFICDYDQLGSSRKSWKEIP